RSGVGPRGADDLALAPALHALAPLTDLVLPVGRDPVAAGPALDLIPLAVARLDPVVARAAAQLVRAAATAEAVVPVASLDAVLTALAVQPVLAPATLD